MAQPAPPEPKSTGKRVASGASKVAGQGVKYAVRALTSGASTAVEKVIPAKVWQWTGGLALIVIGGTVGIIFMIIFAAASALGGNSGVATGGGAGFDSGPLTCTNSPAPANAPAGWSSPPGIPENLIPHFKAAAAYYHIPWYYIAATMREESNFQSYNAPLIQYGNGLAGFNMSAVNLNQLSEVLSYDSALGSTQMEPGTWSGYNTPGIYPTDNAGEDIPAIRFETDPAVIAQYGGYGAAWWEAHGRPNDGDIADPFNPIQDIWATADMLAADGMAQGNDKQAVLSYNDAEIYWLQVRANAEVFAQCQ